jgi:hypothetical protein
LSSSPVIGDVIFNDGTLMLAYDYPILGIFWTMVILFVWIAWLFIFFHVVIDIFRSHDMGGWAKAAWFLAVILLPLFGVFIYVLARGDSMRDRDASRARAQQDDMNAYVRQAAGSSDGVADELTKLNDLKSSGVISDDEFAAQKAKLLA